MISDVTFPSYNILWRFSYKCFRYCTCSTGLGQSSGMISLFPKISCWVFWSIYVWLFLSFHLPTSPKGGSFSIFLFLSLCLYSHRIPCPSLSLLVGWLWKKSSDFFFLTLCVTLRTSDYQLLLFLFLFSNFAKYLYSLDAWGIVYRQGRDCVWKPFSNGKWRAKNPSRINNRILTVKREAGNITSLSPVRGSFFYSLGNDFLQTRAREIRGHGLWNCYFSQLTVCRWHGL